MLSQLSSRLLYLWVEHDKSEKERCKIKNIYKEENDEKEKKIEYYVNFMGEIRLALYLFHLVKNSMKMKRVETSS